jgi:branched-chain amino acid transport system permease protein
VTKLVYPQAANTAVFFVMIIILLLKPQGLFGKRNY